MCVGMLPCGKTKVKDTLAEVLANLNDSDVYMPVTQYVMNPKSIPQGQLYGESDLNTQEWTDGVLAIAEFLKANLKDIIGTITEFAVGDALGSGAAR